MCRKFAHEIKGGIVGVPLFQFPNMCLRDPYFVCDELERFTALLAQAEQTLTDPHIQLLSDVSNLTVHVSLTFDQL